MNATTNDNPENKTIDSNISCIYNKPQRKDENSTAGWLLRCT
jgi:hypothetical protein